MNKNDHNTTLQELKDLVTQFRDERGWQKHHTPKNLSMSIAIEAAELMEHFQWDELSTSDKQDIAHEIADIMSFTLSLADALDIDVSQAYRSKLAHNEQKYPVTLFNAKREGREDYHRIKKAYRQKKGEL